MKRWLLKQKQTQTWETPIATADAVYAFTVSYTHLDVYKRQPQEGAAEGFFFGLKYFQV